jgi:C-terminal processing protease CtpA/Prc
MHVGLCHPRVLIILLIGFTCLFAGWAANSEAEGLPIVGSPSDRAADFDQMWHEVSDNYVYLGDRAGSWGGARSRYTEQVAGARTLDEWTSVLASALSELADFHIEVDPRPKDDWRPVPTCAMIWAEWRDGSALVTGVQPGSNAAKAGVMPGDIVLRLDGRDAGTAMPDGATPQLLNHVLLQELAGRRGASVALELQSPNGAKRSITLSADCAVDRPASPLSAARTPRGYGLIRFNNSLGDTATVSAFDQVLDGMKEAPGLIVDLRDTPSGGNSTVALGILGRFIHTRAPYQMHRIPNYGRPDVERVWLEEVSPRGPFSYTKPVVIIADHWTGSMGEGIAVGFDGLKRAIVVGTSLGRLNGSVETITLNRTHVSVNIPEEQIFHVNGVPRHEWTPPVLVDLVATRGQADPELAAAERLLANLIAAGSSGK